jgi:hypothetical protein
MKLAHKIWPAALVVAGLVVVGAFAVRARTRQRSG